jgi:hypothetical protein
MSICLKSALSLALIVGMSALTVADETRPSTVVKKAPVATAQEPSDAEPAEEPPVPSGPSQAARVRVWNDGSLRGRTWYANPDGSLSPAPNVTVVFGRDGKTVYRAVSDENARFVVPAIVAPNDYELFASANGGLAATMIVSVLPAPGANVKADDNADDDAKSIKVEEEGKSVKREPTRSEKLVALFRKVSAKKSPAPKLAPAPQQEGSTLDVVLQPQDEVVVEDQPIGGGGFGGGGGGFGGGGGGGMGLGWLGLGGLAGLAGLAGSGPASPATP